MLYVTTRNNRDAFTVNRALTEDRCPDGGMYLPFRAPQFGHTEIDSQAPESFAQCLADVLNRLFNAKLTPWDIEFCIGKSPVRLRSLRHRIIIAEFWHNPDWSFNSTVNKLTAMLCDQETAPTDWVKIAVRTAMLFGIFGELKRSGIEAADISLVSGDFLGPISAWYARQWGPPIDNIICCCNENNSLWELLCHGQIKTDALSIPTITPDADIIIPSDLERLIYECGGISEVNLYLSACRQGKAYCPEDSVLQRLRKGLYASVVSSHRLKTVIPSVWQTHGYLMSSYTALAYSGLLDYRAKTGATGYSLVLSEKCPLEDASVVASSLGVPVEVIQNQL